MAMDTVARLKSTLLFSSLDWESLTHLARVVRRVRYARGDIVLPYDAAGDTFFIVDSGEVILRRVTSSGARRPVAYLDEGDYYGQSILMGRPADRLEAQATTTAEVLSITRGDFQRLVESHPDIAQGLGRHRRPIQGKGDLSWLHRREVILLQHRRHWFILALRLILPIVIAIALAAIIELLRTLGAPSIVDSLFSLVFILPALVTLYIIVDWSNDYYAVTTERVLHREKIILTYELLREIPIDKIQNVNLKRGFLGTILNFGTIIVQTASASGNLNMDYVPEPTGMQRVISDLVSQVKSRSQNTELEDIRQHILARTQGTPEVKPAAPAPPPPPSPRPQPGAGILPGLNWLRSRVRPTPQPTNQVVWRKHWIFLVRRTWWLVVLAIILTSFIIQRLTAPSATGANSVVLAATTVFWIAILFLLWWNYVDWANDLYIVDDRQIIDVEKRPLFFAEDRRQAALDMVQNISLVIPGPLAAILNYGNVVIQTAGTGGVFTFTGVGNPAAVQREVFRRVEAYKEAQRERERKQRREEFANWFEIYDQIHRQPPPELPRS